MQDDLFGNGPDPAEERSRATMWDVPRFAECHKYRAIVVENVVDARQWVNWTAWLLAMRQLGYEYKTLFFNSMYAHPTPQSRDRMYVVFWRKGNTAPDLDIRPLAWCGKCCKDVPAVQAWKNGRRWGRYGDQYVYSCPACASELRPYFYAAANAIDWDLPCPRIGDRERPLKEKTLSRIKAGLEKFGRQAMAVDTSFGDGDRAVCLSEPMRTQTMRQTMGLVIPPFLAKLYGTSVIEALDGPMGTQTANVYHALVVPYYSNGQATGVDEALPTVTTVDRHGLVVPPFILGYYTRPSGVQAAVSGIDDALPTQSTQPRHYLVQPGNVPAVEDCGFRMLQPHEIRRAMAFPDDYVVLGTKRERVRQLGNAVTPPVMAMILKRVIATFM
jgi:DNA (cytosine-5)-methyltransferase 1